MRIAGWKVRPPFPLPDSDTHTDTDSDTDSDSDSDTGEPILEECEGGIAFPDKNMEYVLRDLIGKPEGDVLYADVAKIRILDARRQEITDLEGIQCLTNLTMLDFSVNSISDISALAGLTKLVFIDLDRNSISDIAPLVANEGLQSTNIVRVRSNLLHCDDPKTMNQIEALEWRGVILFDDCNNIPPVPEDDD